MMSWAQKWKRDAQFLGVLREFLTQRNFLEVQTPCLQDGLVPELHVPSFSVPHPTSQSVNHTKSSGQTAYLLPSPELAMKAMLCQMQQEGKASSIFQLAHCFRAEEELDQQHQREFLMLELYAVHCDALGLLNVLADLLEALAGSLGFAEPLGGPGGEPLGELWGLALPAARPVVMGLDSLCQTAWSLNFDAHWQHGLDGLRTLYAACLAAPFPEHLEHLDVDDLFHLFLVECVEPYIAVHYPYFCLYPYPDATPLPARVSARPGYVERWELYINGVELANGCMEENRPEYLERYIQRMQDVQCAVSRQSPPAWDYQAVRSWQRLPLCSGAALGLGRLCGRPLL